MRQFTNPNGKTRYQPTVIEDGMLMYAVREDNWGATLKGYDLYWTEIEDSRHDPLLVRTKVRARHIERKRKRKRARKAARKVHNSWSPR